MRRLVRLAHLHNSSVIFLHSWYISLMRYKIRVLKFYLGGVIEVDARLGRGLLFDEDNCSSAISGSGEGSETERSIGSNFGEA